MHLLHMHVSAYMYICLYRDTYFLRQGLLLNLELVSFARLAIKPLGQTSSPHSIGITDAYCYLWVLGFEL